MYFPERVSGKADTTKKSDGTAVAPFLIGLKTEVARGHHRIAFDPLQQQEMLRVFHLFRREVRQQRPRCRLGSPLAVFVSEDRPFDFLGSDAVPGDVDNIVRASVERECTVVVLARIVALCVSEFAVPATEVHLVKSSNIATPAVRSNRLSASPHSVRAR